MNAVLAPLLKSLMENPRRQLDLCKRAITITKEERAIKEKLSTAKPGEKKRLAKELENKKAEHAKLKDLMFRTAGTGGWMGVPHEELLALLKKAKQQDPKRFEAPARRALAAHDEHNAIQEKLETTSSQTKKKRLSTLLGRKEIEFDEAMNEIAVIVDGSEEKDSTELNDVSIRLYDLLAFDESPTSSSRSNR
ncbi:hypothetical protein AAVH_26789 [Aphelenchoides avenae]|nr:hypothetical protein AAVH_26789 [Aphelenchus avenae]